jgi:serine/threonine protein kinase
MKHCPHCQLEYPDSHIECPVHDGVFLIEVPDPRVGSLINNTYLIECKLGRGGMGTVYKARHTQEDDMPIALKFLSAELSQDAEFIDRFKKEAKALREARSENVVDFVDIQRAADGGRFIVMEFIDGVNLRDFLPPAPELLEVGLALTITRGIAEGLGAAHAGNLVHRDIKPENILMAREGDSWVPKIADFGIVASRDDSTRTQPGMLMLTPFYAAPEQWRGMDSSQLDGRTDLYALGGVLFEMITGQKAFTALDNWGWRTQHLTVAPSLPSSLRAELADWSGLDELVLSLLEKDGKQRPENAAEVIRRLDEIKNAHRKKEEEEKKAAVRKSRIEEIKRLDEEIERIEVDRRHLNARIEGLRERRRRSEEEFSCLAEESPIVAKWLLEAYSRTVRRVPLWIWVASVALLAAALALEAGWHTGPRPVMPGQSTSTQAKPPAEQQMGNAPPKIDRLPAVIEPRTMQGETAIASVAFSHDGRTLASGGEDSRIALWDVASAKLSRRLPAHTRTVRSVAFSPDGRTLAWGGGDSRVELWDVASGQVLYTLPAQSGVVSSVSFSPDGSILASGSHNKKIVLWDVISGKMRLSRPLEGHKGKVWSVAFSPDGLTLASGSGDNRIKLWNVDNGQMLRTLEGHTGTVPTVAFNPSGRTLASGSWDNTIKLWDVNSGQVLLTLQGHNGAVISVSFSPDGRILASGSNDHTVKVWDLTNGQVLATLRGHTGAVVSVAFSPDGRTLASGSSDDSIKLWDVAGVRE